MHAVSKHGTTLCGMKGDKIANHDLVTCKQCLGLLKTGIRTDPVTMEYREKKKAEKKKLKEEKPVKLKGGEYKELKPKSPKVEKPKPEPKIRVPKELPFCMCGCVDPETGERQRTKGGRFRPGHDAKYHSSLLPPKPPKEKKEKPPKKEKPKLTGDHRLDTVLGMIRGFNDDQRKRLFLTINERYGMGTVVAA